MVIKVISLREPRPCFLQSKFSSQGNTSNLLGRGELFFPWLLKEKVKVTVSPVLLFGTPWLLSPWNSPGKNSGVGYHSSRRSCSKSSPIPTLLRKWKRYGSMSFPLVLIDYNWFNQFRSRDKKWQEYSEELSKTDLNDPDNHESVITYLEPDILECEVKWTLGSITTNKASGGDGIPVELFEILTDEAVKVLHLICQQIWKTQQWPQDWKRSIFLPIPKQGNSK